MPRYNKSKLYTQGDENTIKDTAHMNVGKETSKPVLFHKGVFIVDIGATKGDRQISHPKQRKLEDK